MDAWAHWKTPGRYDRHVRSALLCVAPQAPVHRLAFQVEEALRLASLPGENEGRSYYFRHLRVAGLPPGGERRDWLENFQRALDREAQQAVHGTDPRAAFSNAVFFRGEPEALEILLRRVLTRQAAGEWFWPMVTGRDSSLGNPSIVDIVQRLRDRPASWVAVAAAVFAAPGCDAVRLLESISPAVAQGWLLELTGPPPLRGSSAPGIPPEESAAVLQALRVFGSSSPRVLWLATLAILLHAPGEMATGTAVWRARSALESLAGGAAGDPIKLESGPNVARSPKPHLDLPQPDAPRVPASGADVPVGRDTATLPASSQSLSQPEHRAADEPMPAPAAKRLRSSPQSPPGPESLATGELMPGPDAEPFHLSRDLASGPESLASSYSLGASAAEAPGPLPGSMAPESGLPAPSLPATPPSPLPTPPGASATPLANPAPVPWYCSGLPTSAAGLFFLLNALRRLGMPAALAGGLAGAGPNFPARVLERLANHAGATPEDPVPVWLHSLLGNDPGGGEPLPCDASCWPANLRLSPAVASRDSMVRVWCLAVRRWCWRVAGIPAREVITRSGVFSVNRTDLDVSLPLDRTDLRVRRAGLDLDPGWLPWFGRVVRFHYRFRGEFRA